uniref:Galectin n=1 Tax=Meloidogyne hapla TaxID=6305 RepID=A0A1I8B981_MELHA
MAFWRLIILIIPIFLFLSFEKFKITRGEILVKINWREYRTFKNQLENINYERFEIQLERQNGIKPILRNTRHYDVVSFGHNKELIIKRGNSLEKQWEGFEQLLWLNIRMNGESEEIGFVPFYGIDQIIIFEATDPPSYQVEPYKFERAIEIEFPERLLHFVVCIKVPEKNFLNLDFEIECKDGDGIFYLIKKGQDNHNNVYFESLFYRVSVCSNDEYKIKFEFDGEIQEFDLHCDEAINEGDTANSYLIKLIFGTDNANCSLINIKPLIVPSNIVEEHRSKHSEIQSTKNNINKKRKSVMNSDKPEKVPRLLIPPTQRLIPNMAELQSPVFSESDDNQQTIQNNSFIPHSTNENVFGNVSNVSSSRGTHLIQEGQNLINEGTSVSNPNTLIYQQNSINQQKSNSIVSQIINQAYQNKNKIDYNEEYILKEMRKAFKQ